MTVTLNGQKQCMTTEAYFKYKALKTNKRLYRNKNLRGQIHILHEVAYRKPARSKTATGNRITGVSLGRVPQLTSKLAFEVGWLYTVR